MKKLTLQTGQDGPKEKEIHLPIPPWPRELCLIFPGQNSAKSKCLTTYKERSAGQSSHVISRGKTQLFESRLKEVFVYGVDLSLPLNLLVFPTILSPMSPTGIPQ